MNHDIVRFDNVSKFYGAVQVLFDVSFTVPPVGVTVLVGRSGSGKSTALRCINRLEKIDGGEIHVLGSPIESYDSNIVELRKKVGIVFQSYNLFPHLDVLRNTTVALRKVKGMPTREAEELGREMIELVGLSDRLTAYPNELSGGQQQRAAIARALAMRPSLMLFDEVTAALDPELTEEVTRVVEKLAANGMTMILVTHEMGFARRIARDVVFMQGGRIHEKGGRDILVNPVTEELQRFIRSEL